MIQFIAGAMFVGVVGIIAMCLCQAAGAADRNMEL